MALSKQMSNKEYRAVQARRNKQKVLTQQLQQAIDSERRIQQRKWSADVGNDGRMSVLDRVKSALFKG